jgi:predicted DNA-binding transcriptional regulator YafY
LAVFLEAIKTALQKQMMLAFQYTDRTFQTSNRIIEPYKLILKENHWYLQGYCLAKQDFRLFKLSRVSNLKMMNETFTPRVLPPAVSGFIDGMSERQTIIKLLIHESIRDRLLDYCSSEHMEPYTDNRFIVHFPFIADDFGYNLLLGFGDKCECIEPLEVRAEVIRRINNLAELYKP